MKTFHADGFLDGIKKSARENIGYDGKQLDELIISATMTSMEDVQELIDYLMINKWCFKKVRLKKHERDAILKDVLPEEGERHYIIGKTKERCDWFIRKLCELLKHDVRDRFSIVTDRENLRHRSHKAIILLTEWERRPESEVDRIKMDIEAMRLKTIKADDRIFDPVEEPLTFK